MPISILSVYTESVLCAIKHCKWYYNVARSRLNAVSAVCLNLIPSSLELFGPKSPNNASRNPSYLIP